MLDALRIEEITTTEHLDNLRLEWAELWRTDRNATPFQSPEWLLPWWRHIGEGDLWTLAVRNADKHLVALAPLYVYTQESGERALFPLGIATSDYLDFLFRPGYEVSATAALLEHLGNNQERWDVCELHDLRPGSPLLSASAPPEWSDTAAVTHEPCPVLPLPATLAELDAALPTLPKRKLRYYWRRSERLGSMTVRAATAADWPTHFDALLRLHRERWAAKGEAGVLAGQGVEAAHREAIPLLLSLGALRMYSVFMDDKIIGSFYGLADPDIEKPGRTWGRRLYCYIGGFDAAYAEVAPGSVLIGHALEQAVKDGITHADFLRGDEPYKYVWSAQNTYTKRRVLRHSKPQHIGVIEWIMQGPGPTTSSLAEPNT